MSALAAKSALLIAGPTASGKSALGLKAARERGGVIINADALQVYADLRLLSARPTAAEEAAAPHRLYGHVSGASAYSVAAWLRDARAAMNEVWAEGRLAILVGGTGLYFKALEEGIADIPPIHDEIRNKWRDFRGDLHKEIQARDPVAAARLHGHDRQRLIRALEVVEGTGRPLSHWQEQGRQGAALNGVQVERMFVSVAREALYARAEARFDRMLAAGALDEVAALPAYDADLPVMKAIGVPELLGVIRGQCRLEDAVVAAKTATRHYIKRQLTWFRGQMTQWPAVPPP